MQTVRNAGAVSVETFYPTPVSVWNSILKTFLNISALKEHIEENKEFDLLVHTDTSARFDKKKKGKEIEVRKEGKQMFKKSMAHWIGCSCLSVDPIPLKGVHSLRVIY